MGQTVNSIKATMSVMLVWTGVSEAATSNGFRAD